MDCPLLEDILHEDDRFAIMIDGANLYQSARALGFDIDYRLLLDTFARCARLVRACYYTALLDDQEYSPIRPLVDWLDYNGYSVVTKPLKEFTDASGRQSWHQFHRRSRGRGRTCGLCARPYGSPHCLDRSRHAGCGTVASRQQARRSGGGVYPPRCRPALATISRQKNPQSG
jgi:uncharacterized LabA/DUF88 family protein